MRDLRDFANETSPGVFHCREWGNRLNASVIDALASEAKQNARSRARLCLHPSVEDSEQQMLIVMTKEARDRPHRHPYKRETMLPILGSAKYEIFDDHGSLTESLLLSVSDTRYVSSQVDVHHRVVPTTELFAFWEFSQGPFDPLSTAFPSWADTMM